MHAKIFWDWWEAQSQIWQKLTIVMHVHGGSPVNWFWALNVDGERQFWAVTVTSVTSQFYWRRKNHAAPLTFTNNICKLTCQVFSSQSQLIARHAWRIGDIYIIKVALTRRKAMHNKTLNSPLRHLNNNLGFRLKLLTIFIPVISSLDTDLFWLVMSAPFVKQT